MRKATCLKFFNTDHEARAWFKENDQEGVAFKCQLGPLRPAGSADQYGVPRARHADATEGS
jgi:hypothetical protein